MMIRRIISTVLVIVFMVSYVAKLLFVGNDPFAENAKEYFTITAWLLLGWFVFLLLIRPNEKQYSGQKEY